MVPETFFITVLDLFNEYGPKFKLDDLASRLRISKKTIYRDFIGKEAVIEATVREVFAAMHRQAQALVDNESLSIVEKMKQAICIYPPMKINFERLSELGEMYPNIYKLIHDEFDTNWDASFALVNQAIQEGQLRPINFDNLKIILVGLFTEMLEREMSEQQRLTRECVDIIFSGYVVEH